MNPLNQCLTIKIGFYLVFEVNKGAHVKFLREGHAVVELDSVHSGVVKVKTFQLQRQQVGKVQKPQTLKNKTQREATIQ